jgi:hypothetical protein
MVLAEPHPNPPTKAYVVVEAKKPTEALEGVETQAFSYTYALRAPYFVISNGRQFEVWQNGIFRDNLCLLRTDVSELGSHRGRVESLLSPAAVSSFLDENGFGRVTLADVDVGPYLTFLADRVLGSGLLERTAVRDSAGRPIQVKGAVAVTELAPVFVQASSGRGKSSLLRLIARMCLEAPLLGGTRRVPILLSLTNSQPGGLHSRIASEVGAFVPRLRTAEAIRSWMNNVPTVLLLDDWHKISAENRMLLEADLLRLAPSTCAIVCAGSPLVNRPSLPNTATVELPAFTDAEQDDFVESVLPGMGHSRGFFVGIPTHLRELLREPIFLSIYTSFCERTHHGGLRKPDNLAGIFERFLDAIAQSVGLKSDQIAFLCQQLCARESFNLEAVAMTCTSAGIELDAANICECIRVAGIWERTRPNSFTFAHDTWRTYFSVLELLAGEDASNRMLDWVRTTGLPELRIGAPIVVGMLSKYKEQNAFLSELLNRDLESYLFALTARVSADFSGQAAASVMLEQLHSGRVDLVENYFPGFKYLLSPWKHSGEDDAGKQVVIVGNQRGAHLTYMFGYAEDADRRAFGDAFPPFDSDERPPYSPSKGYVICGVGLELSGLNQDSGRLIEARRVLEEIAKSIDNDDLCGMEWFARESLVEWVSGYDGILETLGWDKEWQSTSVSEVATFTRKNSGELMPAGKFFADAAPDEVVQVSKSVLLRRERIELAYVADVAESLVELGLGEIPLGELGLPGPDDQKYGCHFGESYSPQQRLARVTKLMTVAPQAYRQACEVLFSKLAHEYLQFRAGPFRMIATVTPNHRMQEWDIVYWWEPAREWGEPAEVSLVPPGGRVYLPEEQLIARTRELWSEWNRTPGPIDYSLACMGGEWNATRPAVSVMVREWLREDIGRLRRLVARGA